MCVTLCQVESLARDLAGPVLTEPHVRPTLTRRAHVFNNEDRSSITKRRT